MSQVKTPNQKKVTIDGVDYTLQHPGARWVMQMTDRTTGPNGFPLAEKTTDEILEYVVVSPKVTIDDFDDDFQGLQQLVSEAQAFLNTKKPIASTKKAGGEQS